MAVFKEGGNWRGTSFNPAAGRSDENHESELLFEEVVRLVATSVALFPLGDIAGEGGKLLGAFRDALNSATTEITIVKGIHQRDLSPHIRASLEVDGERHDYHVNLKTGARATVAEDGRKIDTRNARFVWEPVQVSVAVDTDGGRKVYAWPVGEPSTGMGGRRRGMSFTQGQLETHIAAVSAAAAERKRVADEAAALAAIESAKRSKQNMADLAARAKSGSPWKKLPT